MRWRGWEIALEIKEWGTLIKEDPVNLLGQHRSCSQAVYRIYRASYGQMPRYADFLPDVEFISRGVVASSADEDSKLAANLNDLAERWVDRTILQALYKSMTNGRFVDQLAVNAGVTLAPADRAAIIDKLNNGAAKRAQVLVGIVNNRDFVEREDQRSLVLLHYFGYLRRNPDDPPDGDLRGFNFWLHELELHNDLIRLSDAFKATGEYHQFEKQP